MATLDKEIKIIMLKGESGQDGQDGTDGQDGKSSYELAIENELFSGTLAEWINTFATPENYITRGEFQKVTQAQYDALKQAGELIPNCYYLIIDDTTYEDLISAIDEISDNLEEFDLEITKIKDGRTVVGKADETNKVKMQNDNGAGKRYLLTTPNNLISGEMGTPKYLDWFYLMGDNNGLYVEDIIYAEEIYQKHNGQYKALHLYRHDIEISGTDPNYDYKGYTVYFTIYCNQSTALSINDIANNIGSLNSICASGWVSETLQSVTKRYSVTRIRASYFADDTYSKNIDIFYLTTENYIESAVNYVTSTISDTVTQIF